jgi:large subunit ribosomal protein L13
MNTIAQKVSKQRTLQNVETISYTIDARGRTLGRVASEAASALLGKKSAHYVQNLPEKRIKGKTYQHYTGYPGGLRETPMATMIEKKGIEEVMRTAIDGMIPRNKLRKDRMKRLTITV